MYVGSVATRRGGADRRRTAGAADPDRRGLLLPRLRAAWSDRVAPRHRARVLRRPAAADARRQYPRHPRRTPHAQTRPTTRSVYTHTHTHTFNGPLSATRAGTRKVVPIWIKNSAARGRTSTQRLSDFRYLLLLPVAAVSTSENPFALRVAYILPVRKSTRLQLLQLALAVYFYFRYSRRGSPAAPRAVCLLPVCQSCTSLQTDSHANTSPLSFYRPDALPAAQPTASKH